MEFKTYKWRWVNLAFFCGMTMMQNFLVFGFAPISETVVDYYLPIEYGITAVNLLNAVTLLTAIPLFLTGPKILSKYSLRAAVIWLVAADCIGSLFRFFGRSPTVSGYWLIFVGQTIVSLGQVVSWGGSTKLSLVWFDEKERPLATSLSSMSNLLGIALSYIFSPIIVPDDQPNEVETLLLIHMAVCCSLGVLTLIFFRASPPTPASRSSMDLINKSASLNVQGGGEIQESYCATLKILLKNRDFVLVAIIFGMGFGFFNGLFTVLNQMMVPQGYTNKDVGLFGVLVIFSGVFGGAISGTFVGKTRQYKNTITILISTAAVIMLLFVFAVKPDNKAQISICLAFIGLYALSLTPVFLEIAAEYTFPVSESMSSGILCAWGSFVAFFFIILMTELTTEVPNEISKGNWLGFGGFAFAGILSLFLSNNYKRSDYDRIGDGV